jgi:hypothetical protein
MGRVRLRTPVPGPAEASRELWYDPSRWPTFVDGFGALVRRDPEWPEGGVVIWDSTPHGGGRMREVVVAPDVVEIETEQLRGRRSTRFGDDAIEVELVYELKRLNPIVDLLFVRRALRDSLRRTLRRFAIERESEA